MQIQDIVRNVSGTNVIVTTTTEEVAITSPRVRFNRHTALILVIAWAQLTTGAGTTATTVRIRRGNAITGDLLNEANATSVSASAGGTEVLTAYAIAVENGKVSEQYSMTVEQGGASGNGTILQAAIAVIAL